MTVIWSVCRDDLDPAPEREVILDVLGGQRPDRQGPRNLSAG